MYETILKIEEIHLEFLVGKMDRLKYVSIK